MTRMCKHYMFDGNTCAGCGKSKSQCGNPRTTTMNYIKPMMSLSSDAISGLRDKNLQSLVTSKKLHLVLDLDQTLIHTSTRLDRRRDNDLIDLKLDTHDTRLLKLRPGARSFVEELSSIFDISIYTLACKIYADKVAKVMDPKRCIFKTVMSREDCTKFGQKGLDVVLSHERVVLIVDDTKRVWTGHGANLIHIEPYTYFGSVDHHAQGQGSTMDAELARVLRTLKAVHGRFYDGQGDYSSKDVRQVLRIVGCDLDQDNSDKKAVVKSETREVLNIVGPKLDQENGDEKAAVKLEVREVLKIVGPELDQDNGEDEKAVVKIVGPELDQDNGDQKAVVKIVGPELDQDNGDEKAVVKFVGPELDRDNGDEKAVVKSEIREAGFNFQFFGVSSLFAWALTGMTRLEKVLGPMITYVIQTCLRTSDIKKSIGK